MSEFCEKIESPLNRIANTTRLLICLKLQQSLQLAENTDKSVVFLYLHFWTKRCLKRVWQFLTHRMPLLQNWPPVTPQPTLPWSMLFIGHKNDPAELKHCFWLGRGNYLHCIIGTLRIVLLNWGKTYSTRRIS